MKNFNFVEVDPKITCFDSLLLLVRIDLTHTVLLDKRLMIFFLYPSIIALLKPALSAGVVEYADRGRRICWLNLWIEVRLPPKECPGYDIKRHLKLRLQSFSFGKSRVLLHCHYSQIHRPESVLTCLSPIYESNRTV